MSIEIIEALTVIGGAMGVCAWGMYAFQGTIRLTGRQSMDVLRSAAAVIVNYLILWGILFGSGLLLFAVMPWLKFFGWVLLVLFFDNPMVFVWTAVGGIVLGMFW